jgi:hypothetical protein
MVSTPAPCIHSSQDAVRFNTEHRIGSGTKRGYSEQLVIPFDRYSLHAFVAAIDPTTNLSVDIAQFVVTAPLGGFEIVSPEMDTSKSTPYLVLRSLSAVIKRSKISQMFTLSLALFNWFLTIGMIYATILVIFGKIEANSTVAFMPFSMMLTIPVVRGLYADSPSLGASFGTLRIRQLVSSSFDSLYIQIRRASLCNFCP